MAPFGFKWMTFAAVIVTFLTIIASIVFALVRTKEREDD